MFKLMTRDHNEEAAFYNSYFKIKAQDCITYKYSNDIDQDVMDIYVITFNSIFCMEYQIKTIRAFVKQKYNLIIVDNNNDLNPEVSKKTLEICKKENLTYIKAPNNFFQGARNFDPSLKLGTTMSWIYLNCARDRKAKYFGFLDQDCFLFADFDITEYLDTKHMYGQISKKPDLAPWNLHVTSNFYRYEFVKDLVLDFRPCHKYQLDTGGCNYDILYKDHNYKDYEFDVRGFRFFDFDIGSASTFQYYTMHDHRWIHMCGSAEINGKSQVDTKESYIKGFLDCVLGRNDRSF